MKIVYRIQDSNGRGPFKPGFSHLWSDGLEKDPSKLKPIYEEFAHLFPLPRGPAYGVGCRNLDQLRLWFSAAEYEALLGFGYQCVRLEVDRVLGEGETQLLFRRSQPLNIGAVAVDLYALEIAA